jgi:hypothetical protein
MLGLHRLPRVQGREPSSDFTKRLLRPMARLLETGNPAATVDRLFRSQHVTDLQLIVAVALLVVLVVFCAGFVLSIENEVQSKWKTVASSESYWIFLNLGFGAAGSFLTFFVPILAVFGAVLAWAYQVGSARLGVVDLFACEISTLCRVTTVVDTVHRYVDKFEKGPPTEPAGSRRPQAHPFTSQENYFPVFESNTRDLQTLEARVVIHVTEFYTYMKAFRDSLRSLGEIRPEPAEFGLPSNKSRGAGPWHEAACNIVYMMFLGLESARHAVADLVEFEPERAERTAVILIGELEAYRFLCAQYADEQDMHHGRIRLRTAAYRYLVPKLCASIEAGSAAENAADANVSPEPGRVSQWEPAWQLLPELKKRYHAAIGVEQPARHEAVETTQLRINDQSGGPDATRRNLRRNGRGSQRLPSGQAKSLRDDQGARHSRRRGDPGDDVAAHR